MVYECTDRRGQIYTHTLSDALSSRQAMERLGVWQRPFKVVRWPTGRPDKAHCVQQFEIHEVDTRLGKE